SFMTCCGSHRTPMVNERLRLAFHLSSAYSPITFWRESEKSPEVWLYECMWPITKLASPLLVKVSANCQFPFSRSVLRMLDWSYSRLPPNENVCEPRVHVAWSRIS